MSEPAGVNEERRKLRVEVILEDAVVPRWIASLIDRLASAGFVELAGAVVASKPMQARAKPAVLALSLYDRDVVINLALSAASTSSGRPRLGEWSVHHGGSRAWHSEPPFFWETYRQEPVVVTSVCAQRPEDDARV